MSWPLNKIPTGAALMLSLGQGLKQSFGAVDGQRHGAVQRSGSGLCCEPQIRGNLATRTYSPHSTSAFLNISWASSGLRVSGSEPDSARNFLVSSPALISLNQALIWPTIGRGVAAGSITPHQRSRLI